MRKASLTYENQKGLYQSKVTFNFTFTQRQGHQAHNCKMVYSVNLVFWQIIRADILQVALYLRAMSALSAKIRIRNVLLQCEIGGK